MESLSFVQVSNKMNRKKERKKEMVEQVFKMRKNIVNLNLCAANNLFNCTNFAYNEWKKKNTLLFYYFQK